MGEGAHKILKDALGLPVQDRADLIAELLASLEGEADEDVEAAWAAELERRARAARADPDGGEPWDAVRNELTADLDRK
jgi:putative addiction module component (TIGR02574 family)